MKLNKKNTGAIIFAFLVLLLFFSRTIYTYNMPQVTGTRPRQGSLSQLEIARGIARWAETESIYAIATGTVGRVFVNEGDWVEEGQILFETDFDMAAAERRYLEIINNIERLEFDIQSSRNRLSGILAALADNSDTAAASLSGQGGIISLEINRARQTLRNTEIAYELGSVSRNDFINAELNLQSLLYRYQAEAEDLEHSLRLKQLDLLNLRLSRDAARDALGKYMENGVVLAPVDGIITNLNVERGKLFHENALMASIGLGNEFIIECMISLDNNFVITGDICELRNTSHTLRGTVWRVRPLEHGKSVSISVISGDITDGETFDIVFEKTSAASFLLVPSAAIFQDNDGYYLYQIKRRRGIMGEEYFLERINIYIGESDHQNTSVVRGLTFFDPIVLLSDKALYSGMTVTLRNPEDFFEN